MNKGFVKHSPPAHQCAGGGAVKMVARACLLRGTKGLDPIRAAQNESSAIGPRQVPERPDSESLALHLPVVDRSSSLSAPPPIAESIPNGHDTCS